MGLDELHARRLATVASVFENALDRMGLVLESLEDSGGDSASSLQGAQIQQAREKLARIRRRLHAALDHFSVRLDKPDPRQVLAAELSTLWVVLENSRPERMKGYGKGLAPAERRYWEDLVHSLLDDVEQLRICTRGRQDRR